MSSVALIGAVELGLIYALLALGIFVSYRVLNIADLTVDGSFTTGAAVCAVFTARGNPGLGIVLAVLASAAAGLCSALLQTKLRVQPILAGILTMTALYSINLRIMGGKANVALLRIPTIFTLSGKLMGGEGVSKMVLPLVATIFVAAALILFFRTQLGLSIRATGDNEEMVRSSSINSNFTKTVGLCLANALVGLSGAMVAQFQGFADISMGIGMVVVALASLIIGEAIFGRKSVGWNIGAVIVGAVIYRIILALVLSLRFNASDLKLLSALLVAAAISYPALKNALSVYRLKKAGEKDA